MRKSFFALILGFTLSGGALAQQPPTKSSFKDDPEVCNHCAYRDSARGGPTSKEDPGNVRCGGL